MPDTTMNIYSFEIKDNLDVYVRKTDGSREYALRLPKLICSGQSSHEQQELARKMLKNAGYVFVEEPKPKVNLTRQKIILRSANRIAYILKIKGTDECIVSLTQNGVFKSSSSKKPMLFTKADIDLIGNLDEFEVIEHKLYAKAKDVRNKIA